MRNYIALEWHRGGIRGLDAEVTGNAVHLRASFAADWPEELDVAQDAEAVGRWLKSRLDAHGQRDRQLIVLVSREDIVMRLLALPEADDQAVPDLVRYQAAARSSVPLDQLVLDYVPLVAAPPQGGRWVQTATVAARLPRHIVACATAAGLDLVSVGATTVALGEAIARAERLRELPADQTSLIVRVVDGQLDVALWRGSDLLFGHFARATDANGVLSEVQRALMSHNNAAGSAGVGRAWLIASPASAAELQTTLATRLGCEVIVFDPSCDIPASADVASLREDASGFVAALGALQAEVHATVPTIDFLKPRRRVVKRDRATMAAAVAIGVLLVLLPVGCLALYLHSKSLDRRIAEQANIVQARSEELLRGEPAREAMAFLSAWDGQRANWLEQMQRIADEMPGTESVFLDRWRFDVSSGEALGTTEAIGFARRRQDAERFSQRLAEQPGFRIRPNPIGTGDSDSEYPILFQLNAELLTTNRRPARTKNE